MSKLGQLLSYLERPGVTELIFCSGAPAVMRSANRLHPLTVTPLQVSQIFRFFEGTPVIPRLPKGGDVPPHTEPMELLGVTYQVTVAGIGGGVEVRITKEAARRSGTWTDLPAVDVPVMRERRTSTGEGLAAPAPPPGGLTARTFAIERDGSSGMLAAANAWTIERNDDHPDMVQGEAATRRDVTAIPLPLGPEHDEGEPALGEVEDSTGHAFARRAAPTPPPTHREIARRGATPTEAASDSPASERSSAAPVFVPPRRPGSAPVAAASARHPSSTVPATSARHPSSTLPTASARHPSATVPAAAMRDPSSSIASAATVRDAVALGTAPRPAVVGTHQQPRATQVPPRLRELLVAARQQGASDVHVMAANPVRMRKAGALEPVGEALSPAEVEAMVMPLLPPAHAAQLEALGYADLATDVEGAGRMRVNVTRQRTGLKLCTRLVASEPGTIASLGLPPEVHKLTTHHQGMVIVSGPSGHGKTTSMAALVDMFNIGHAMHIITVEDPVEVIHPRKQAIVTQREVGTHTRSFARALTAALREDPDVIAIGELRDRETVEMALSASETGHLVLATMSTPSAAKTIDRLIDMFPPDDQSQVRATLAGALKLVLSQRLLRRADGRGLVAAFEMITGGVPLWSLIRDNKLFQLPSLMQRGRNFGMIGLDDSLRELLTQGVITREEALLHAEDPKALAPRESPTPPPSNAGGPGWRFGRGR